MMNASTAASEAHKYPLQATHNLICQQDIINPLSKMAIQMASILVLAHLFHLILKLFYNSGPIAHILAGLLLGPVGLSRIPEVKDFFSSRSTLEYYPILAFLFTVLFMFHIGLEVDISYSLRTLKSAATVSYYGLGLNFIIGAVIAFVLNSDNFLGSIGDKANPILYSMSLIIFLVDTSPPAVARVAAEVKIATSNIGRLAVSCSLINDMSCVILYLLMVAFQSWKMIGRGILALLVTCGSIFLIKYIANWFNQRNRSQKYLRNPEFFVLISVLIICSSLIEALSFNSSLQCFLLGVLFPREGRCMRTFIYKLSFFINNVVLPLFYGYMGFQCNVLYFNKWNHSLTIVMMVVMSLLGKLGGSIVACQQLKLPISEGVLIGFLLNLKGHMDLVLLSGVSEKLQWTLKSQDMLLTSMVINSAISGIGVAIFVKKQEQTLALAHRNLEPQDPDNELRVLGSVHSSRHAPSIIAIITALRGSQSAPITPYLIHLIELSDALESSNTALYHELEEYELNNDEDYGGNDVLEINEAVDACAVEAKIFIHQIKVVSSFGAMYEEVCDHAEDLRVFLILKPFHKHQRIDGKLESGKDGIRTTNQRVLRHAPCSVGIVVSRGPAGIPSFNQILGSETIQQVATLFFGGGDDQEALACSKRLASHCHVNLTVIRFVATSPSASAADKVSNLEDDAYLADFYNRYIRSGKVGYVEKQVSDGKETAEVLKEIRNMYSLLIVGKGKRGHSPLTTGMSDWEECPELGIVGDMLASSEFNGGGSVLIIQQHRSPM